MADQRPTTMKGGNNPVMPTSNPPLLSTENDVPDSYAQQGLGKETEYTPTYESTEFAQIVPKEPGQW